jgi:alpha-D-ribose 1-methylphosphonate 5-triphosphate synthase subunit PhnI
LESKLQLLEKIRRWKVELEERGLRLNIGNTKVMKCQAINGLKEDAGD